MSKLKDFAERMRWNAIVPSVISTSDGTEYIHFHNGQLEYMSREDLQFIADEINRTLQLGEKLDNFIKDQNRRSVFLNLYNRSKYDENKFALPIDRLGISLKTFNPEKRNWGFKCGNCSTKVSSKDMGKYISITSDQEFNSTVWFERGCCSGCAKVIVKDYLQDWINDREEDIKYFYIDNLSEQIDKYFHDNNIVL